ncbi:hypothetical protein [Actinophytocola sp. KF-1]
MKQLAAKATAARPLTGDLPQDLVDYLINVVDLTTVTTEPAQLQKALGAIMDEITTAPEEDFTEQLRQRLGDRAGVVASRAGAVLLLMNSALDAALAEPDEQWQEYFTRKCTEAIDVLTQVKSEAAMVESNMRDYPDDSIYD